MGARLKTPDWTAGSLVGLPIYLGARVARAPYLYTVASLSTTVMSETGAVVASLDDPSGWLAESAASLERFPDDNTVSTLYAWMLAPVIRSAQVQAKAGYAIARQDSKETRFTIAGRYDPYYTPERYLAHSVIGSLALKPSAKTSITVRGSYAFNAREYAPTLSSSTFIGAVDTTFTGRNINPWDAHLAIASALPAL